MLKLPVLVIERVQGYNHDKSSIKAESKVNATINKAGRRPLDQCAIILLLNGNIVLVILLLSDYSNPIQERYK